MFGSKRKKAVKHAVGLVRPLIDLFHEHYGSPAGFWQNEYVLGYVGFLLVFHINHTSGINLSVTDKGFALSEAFEALSNLNGAEITRNYTALAEQDEIPEVVEAKTVADFAGMTDDRSAIAGHMFKNLFADIVVKQLS